MACRSCRYTNGTDALGLARAGRRVARRPRGAVLALAPQLERRAGELLALAMRVVDRPRPRALRIGTERRALAVRGRRRQLDHRPLLRDLVERAKRERRAGTAGD